MTTPSDVVAEVCCLLCNAGTADETSQSGVSDWLQTIRVSDWLQTIRVGVSDWLQTIRVWTASRGLRLVAHSTEHLIVGCVQAHYKPAYSPSIPPFSCL